MWTKNHSQNQMALIQPFTHAFLLFRGLFCALFLLSCISRAATTLQVQFEQTASANDQAGWVVITDGTPPASGSVASGDFSGLTYTADGTHARSHPHHVQYLEVDHTDGDLDNLLSGGVLSNSSSSNVSLNFTGLADGYYQVTTYHHTPYSRTDGFDFDVNLTDVAVSNSLIHDDVPASFGGSVTTAGLASLTTNFFVAGGSPVTLDFIPGTGFDGGGGDHLNLNGFELLVLPEPSRVVVLGLGGLTLLLRRRR